MEPPDNPATDETLLQQGGASVKRWLLERLPVWQEIKKYQRKTFRADLTAAATVALVTIPQAIGFALIAGLPPLMVVMSAVVGGLVAAVLSSSHHLVFGPSNSISIILAATIYSFGGLAMEPTQIAVLLAILIGVMQLGAGLAKMGQLTQFISRSVIIGYGTAISVLLVSSQLPHLLGVREIDRHVGFFGGLIQSGAHIAQGDFSIYSAVMGVFTLFFFHAIEHFFPKAPAEFIGLVCLSLLSQFLHLSDLGIRTIAEEGALAARLPSFVGLPLGATDVTIVPSLLSAAMAIAILGMLEAISISKTLATRSGQRVDSNQELISLGSANIVNSLFGAMPGSASFARSGANFQSGARTQLSAAMSSVIVLIALLFCARLINYIPVPSLAAHLIRIGWRMFDRDTIYVARRATGSDGMVFWVTLAAAIFLKLDAAIYVGVGTSLALFLKKAATPTLVEYTFNESGNLAALREKSERSHNQISIIHVEGELFFGAADIFESQVRSLAEDDDIKVFILRMKNARHLDATTVMALLELHDYLKEHGRHLLISGISADVARVLKNSHAVEKLGDENIFPAEANPTISTKRALERATQLLHTRDTEVRIFYDRPQEPN
ncbi:MAG TPA: SulP family inorganic anion transporter [Candidatus Didemnitutus sp.]|nr:SulP family inorganic anion transporter [Candidatus Didemnitutus sp.]